ncbi:MAG: acyl-CoA reductase [Dehalococcoidia bacterium]
MWYLPHGIDAGATETSDGLERLACVTPELIRQTVDALDRQADAWCGLSIHRIVAAIDAVVASWTRPAPVSPYRAALLRHGPVLTRLSEPMLGYALGPLLRQFDAEGLYRLLRDELGDAAVLDGFVPVSAGATRLARGPGRQFQVLAGSVPTVGIFSLICALLLKSPVLIKPSAYDPIVPALFAQALAEVEPRLAGAMAVVPWRGGAEAIEREAMRGTGAVIAYGADATVAAIQRRVAPGTRFIGHGNKLSVAAITREALATDTAAAMASLLAWDVALFDQQGCLSPQCIFVETGGEVTPAEFAGLLAARLAALEVDWPRGRIASAEAAQIQEVRSAAAFRQSIDAGASVWQSDGNTNWTVLLDRELDLTRMCKNRSAVLVAVDNLDHDLPRHCGTLPISTIGIAASEPRLPELTGVFARLATRFCPIGTMGEPPVTWRHDGRPNLSDLVTWVDLETG